MSTRTLCPSPEASQMLLSTRLLSCPQPSSACWKFPQSQQLPPAPHPEAHVSSPERWLPRVPLLSSLVLLAVIQSLSRV